MFDDLTIGVNSVRLHGVLAGRLHSVSAIKMAPTSNAAIVCRNRSERPASTQRAVSHLNFALNEQMGS